LGAEDSNKSLNRLKIPSHSSLGKFILISVLIFLTSASVGWCVAKGYTSNQNASNFSFNFQNESFREACKEISRATGYEIRFNDTFANLPITAVFEETTAFGALQKILGAYNHSLVLNEEARSIEVFIIPGGNLPAGKGVAGLASSSEESAGETHPEDMEERIENNDPTVAEAMEAYAEEYVMQTAASGEADLIEAADINEYAEEYIRRSKIDEPVAIEAESMEAYAQEYIKQTSPVKDPDFVEATDINSYVEAYINHISKNDKVSSPIIASDPNEYANEYIRRQREGAFENQME
jgi:hypothetical protein